VLVEGRWSAVGDDSFDDPDRMPWAGGVRSEDLRAAVAQVAEDVHVVQLTDPVLWGRDIDDERYLLAARVPSA
jgi:ketosteroid isomerase-like protein